MSRICVVYHSGFGHTKAQADAVADGARSVPDTEVHQIPVQQVELGADGVQIGTAFLACEESNAHPAHREALLGSRAVDTVLTRAFSGRLARGLRNTLADALENRSASVLPYPQQSQLVGALRDEALRRGRTDLISLWSGQSRPLLRHRQAKELFQDLVAVTERTLNRQAQGADG